MAPDFFYFSRVGVTFRYGIRHFYKERPYQKWNTMPLRFHIALCCWLAALMVCQGQDAVAEVESQQFFAAQARADGLFEQQLIFNTVQDEEDYWADQRAYERELYKRDAKSYASYILSKRKVYAAHEPLCGDRCLHGDYYYMQLAFYLQFGEEDATVLSSLRQGQNAAGPVGILRH